MVSIESVNPCEIDIRRLDGDFYQKKYIANDRTLRNCDIPLSILENCSLRTACGPFGSNLPSKLYRDNGIPLYRVQNVREGNITEDGLVFLDKDTSDDLSSCAFVSGDLLIAKSGNLGRVANVPRNVAKCNVTQDVIGVSIDTSIADPHYLTAFFSCYFGRLQIVRYGQGNVQQHLNMPSVREFFYPNASSIVQKFIGNKVRQAERLREWAKNIEVSSSSIFKNFENHHGKIYDKYSSVGVELLTHMLTAGTYKQEYIDNQKRIIDSKKYKSILSYFNSISNGYDERSELDSGMPYLKVANIRPGMVNFEDCPKISPLHWNEATQKQRPGKGDLLITRKGSFGIAAIVHTDEKFLVSSEVFVCKPKNIGYMPLLAHYINSYSGQCQFWQFSTGTTMPGINQQNLFYVLIPDLSQYDIANFNKVSGRALSAKLRSKDLTNAARQLIESLIDGKISENELIQAQQTLEKGDNTLDRQILGRLKRDGIDSDGVPLFNDLDQLYALLNEASDQKNEA
jgi:type I restriction enzyme, S subunit